MAELRSGYGVLKEMFDNLQSRNAIPVPLDNATNIYRDAFGVKLSYLPKYIFTIKVYNNPIRRIVVFCTTDGDKIHCGAMPSIEGLDYICHIDECFDYGITPENVDKYIDQVYNIIYGIVSKDILNICGPDEPYGIFIRSVAFYMTFHHVYNVAFDALNNANEDIFNKYLEKFIANKEDIPKVMQSISGEKFNPTFESICRVMTCEDTVAFK